MHWQLGVTLICVAAAAVFVMFRASRWWRGDESSGCSGCERSTVPVVERVIHEDEISLPDPAHLAETGSRNAVLPT